MTDQTEEPNTSEAVTLINLIKPLLQDQSEPVIGTALANLVALYTVAHVADTPYKTQKLREQVLQMHLAMVKQLMPLAERMVHEQQMAAIHDSHSKARPN